MRARVFAAAIAFCLGLGAYAAIAAAYSGRATWTSPLLKASSAVPVPKPAVKLPNLDRSPARLIIPAIGVDAKVESRGLDSRRNMDTPADFHDVAWYRLGPKPGEPGNALINGHVNWWTGDAVFAHLSRLRAGDEVRVVRGDGVSLVFKVTGTRTVDANSRVASLFAASDRPTLTLITCTGIWNPLTQSDTQRLLVSATIA